jgi:hypothetical protein
VKLFDLKETHRLKLEKAGYRPSGLQKMVARRPENLRFPGSRNDRNFSCLSEAISDCQASLRNFSGASSGLRPFSVSQALFVHFGAAKMDTQPG